MNVLRKGLTWSLIFAMTFTPVMTSLGLTSVMADGEENQIIVDRTAIELGSNNLTEETQNVVEQATASYVAAGAAEIAAQAAEDAAQDAEDAAQDAKDAAQNVAEILADAPALTGDDSVSAKVETANTAVEEANTAVDEANAAVEAANAAIEAANAAIATANNDAELAAAKTAAVEAAKQLADAEIAKKTAQEALVKALAQDAEEQKKATDAAVDTAMDTEAVDAAVDKAEKDMSDANAAVNNALDKIKAAEEANAEWEQKADREAQALADAKKYKELTEAEIAIIEESKAELDETVKAAQAEAEAVVKEVKDNIETALSTENLEGLTVAEISETALESAKTAKESTDALEKNTAAEMNIAIENSNTVINAVYNGSMEKGELLVYAHAASAAADRAEAYAKAAQGTADAAKEAERVAKENYDALKKLVEEYTKKLEAAQKAYEESLTDANEKADEINTAIETANADIKQSDIYSGTLKGAINHTKTAAEAANAAQSAANAAVSDANEKINTADSSVETADDAIAAKNSEIATANEEIAKYKDAAKAVNDGIATNDELTDAANNEIEKVQAAAKEEKDAYDTASASILAAQDAISSAKELIETADGKKNTAAAEVQEAIEALNDATNALDEADGIVADAQTEVNAAMQAKNDALEAAETAATQAALAATNAATTEDTLAQFTNGGKTYEDLLNEVASAEDDKNTAESELNGAKSALEIAENEKTAVDAEQGALLEQYKADKEKCESTISANEKIVSTLTKENISNGWISDYEKAKDYIGTNVGKKVWIGLDHHKVTEADKKWAANIIKQYNDAIEAKNKAEKNLDDVEKNIETANETMTAAANAVAAAEKLVSEKKNLYDAAEGVLTTAQGNLSKVNDFVFTSENTLVLTDIEQYASLVEEVKNKYADYKEVDVDTSAYAIAKNPNLIVDGWNAFLGLFGADAEYYEIKTNIENKYGFSWFNEGTNMETLVQVTNGKCVLTCGSLEQLSVIKATIAESNAKKAEADAAEKSKQAKASYDEAKSALDAFNAAKENVTELLYGEDDIKTVNAISTLNEGDLAELGDKSGRYNKRNNNVANLAIDYSQKDLKEYDTNELDEAKAAYNNSKDKVLKTYGDDDKKISTDPKSVDIAKLLAKFNFEIADVEAFESMVNFDILGELLDALEDAEEAYNNAKEEAEKAQEVADKAAAEAKVARQASENAFEAIKYYRTSDSSDDPGEDIVVTPAPITVLPVATAGLPVAGVAGVRRANAVAAAETNTTDDIKVENTVTAKETPDKKVETADTKETTLTTIEDEEVALAAAPVDANKSMNWWWLVVVAAILAAGYVVFRKYAQNKLAKESISNSINKKN